MDGNEAIPMLCEKTSDREIRKPTEAQEQSIQLKLEDFLRQVTYKLRTAGCAVVNQAKKKRTSG